MRVEDVPLEQIDVAHPRLFRDARVLPYLARLRREAPVHYCADSPFGPYWSITRYEDIQAIELDPETFSSDYRLGGIELSGMPGDAELFPAFITMDPPEHGVRRKTVTPMFSRSSLERLGAIIRARAARILDELPIGEEFDWVDRVSIELTAMTLATLFDFPLEEWRKLARWSIVMTAAPGGPIVATQEQKRAELQECFARFTELWNARVNRPPAGDLISLLAHGETTRNMTVDEFYGSVTLLIIGGNDTTRNSISGSVYALNHFPEQYTRLREDPSLVAKMVSETLRWHTPAAHMRRTARMDVEFQGRSIRKGDKLALWYISANRDETAIEQPDEFIIDRAQPRRHLSFGHGIHRCVGASLAELQLQIIWEEILKRFPTIELCSEPRRTFSSFINGFDWMPVRIPRRT
jgi:cytochrome P450